MTLVGGDLPVRCTPLPVTSTRWVGRPWLQLGLVWLLDKAAKHSTLFDYPNFAAFTALNLL